MVLWDRYARCLSDVWGLVTPHPAEITTEGVAQAVLYGTSKAPNIMGSAVLVEQPISLLASLVE